MNKTWIFIFLIIFENVCIAGNYQLETTGGNLVLICNGNSEKVKDVITNYKKIQASDLTLAEKRLSEWFLKRADIENNVKAWLECCSPDDRKQNEKLVSNENYFKNVVSRVKTVIQVDFEFSMDYKNKKVFVVTEYLRNRQRRSVIVMDKKQDNWYLSNQFVMDPIYQLLNQMFEGSNPSEIKPANGQYFSIKFSEIAADPCLNIMNNVPDEIKSFMSLYGKDSNKMDYFDKRYHPINMDSKNLEKYFRQGPILEAFVDFQGLGYLFCKFENTKGSGVVLTTTMQDAKPVFTQMYEINDPLMIYISNKYAELKKNEAKPTLKVDKMKFKEFSIYYLFKNKNFVASIPVDVNQKNWQHLTLNLGITIKNLEEDEIINGDFKKFLDGQKFFQMLEIFYPRFEDILYGEFSKLDAEGVKSDVNINKVKLELIKKANITFAEYGLKPRIADAKFENLKIHF